MLCHLRERERALANLVSSLAPGGVLVIEEPSRGVEAIAGRSRDLFNRTMHRIRRVQDARGFSYAFAASLPRRFLAHGLTDIHFSSRYDVLSGNADLADLIRTIWRQVGEAAGVSLSAALDALEDEDLVLAGFENAACIGRRAH